jgi:hypothetical protein
MEGRVKRAEILNEAKAIITKDRAATHGAAENSFAQIAGHWTWWLNQKLAPGQTITALDVAQMMVGFKQARVKGNPGHADNHLDLVGYGAIGGELAGAEAEQLRHEGGSVSYWADYMTPRTPFLGAMQRNVLTGETRWRRNQGEEWQSGTPLWEDRVGYPLTPAPPSK